MLAVLVIRFLRASSISPIRLFLALADLLVDEVACAVVDRLVNWIVGHMECLVEPIPAFMGLL